MKRDWINVAQANKRSKVLYHPQVEVIESTDGVLIASFRGVEFCRLAYSPNHLLRAIYEHLKRDMLNEQVEALMESRPDTPDMRIKAEEESLDLFNHHAAGVSIYLSENLQFVLGSILETYMNIGGLYAKQDRDRQLERKFTPVTGDQIKEIFNDLALRALKEQAGVTGGRHAHVTDEQIKSALHVLGRRASQQKVANYIGADYNAISNWRRRKDFKTWAEAKEALMLIV